MGKYWWDKSSLRIYHPNAKESEMQNMDVKAFIRDCAATHAEAIVISVGGIYAFYPSTIPDHYISPTIQDKDLVQEITDEARKNDLRVLARLDFSKARQSVWEKHPEWFRREADGKFLRSGQFYVTCPMGGYQNEEFAQPVLEEVLTKYDVDGFHLNAEGFHGFCYCNTCMEKFGQTIPQDKSENPERWNRFLHWRSEAMSEKLKKYYNAIRRIKSDAFLMGEFGGIEYSQWNMDAGVNLTHLDASFSQLLLTSGGLGAPEQSRWWVGMSTEQARAALKNPIINIKLQMRDVGLAQAFMPPAEFNFYCYQAIAHGAGLKLATFGIPQNMFDKRVMQSLNHVFKFMKEQEHVLESTTFSNHVALVWPEKAISENMEQGKTAIKGLRGEFAGLYAALKARHVLFDVVFDEQLSDSKITQYDVIILPTAVYLSDADCHNLISFVNRGGRLVVSEANIYDAACSYPSMPSLLTNWLGGKWSEASVQADYAWMGKDSGLEIFPNINIIPLRKPYRKVEAGATWQVWLFNIRAGEQANPEDLGLPQLGQDPILMVSDSGKGSVVYIATGIGETILNFAHVDYYDLIETMLYGDGKVQRTLITDAPNTVDITLGQWKMGRVIHMVNGSGSIPLDKPVCIQDIQLSICLKEVPEKIELFMPDEEPVELSWETRENRLIISVPKLTTYAQVVIQ